MTVPVMRTSLKVGNLSIPITEIFNNNDGYVRNELDPIFLNLSQPKMHFKQKKKMELNGLLPVEKKPRVQSSDTASVRPGTMKCPHTIDKSDGTKAPRFQKPNFVRTGVKAECQYSTNRIGNYRRHEKDMHITVNKVECCNLRFLYRADFRLHATEIHNGGKEFQCLECPATFIRRALLVRHLSVHDPSLKNHKCELCPYSTSHATNLQRHYRVHDQDMTVNWDGEYAEETYGFSMEDQAEFEHSFYQNNPYLSADALNYANISVVNESENKQAIMMESSDGKRKRTMEEDSSMEAQRPNKIQMNQTRGHGTSDNYTRSEENISNSSHQSNNHDEDRRISSDNFPANTNKVKQEQDYLLDNTNYSYPSFLSFPNWHPLPFSSSQFNQLPSLDSALSTPSSHTHQPFPLDSAFIPCGPAPLKDEPVPKPGVPVWISSYDDNPPVIKPQFFQHQEHVRSSSDDSPQDHLSERGPPSITSDHVSEHGPPDNTTHRPHDGPDHVSERCEDGSKYHLTELVPFKK